jgi:hypothetical protein
MSAPTGKTFQNLKKTIYFQKIGQSVSTTLTTGSSKVFKSKDLVLTASSVISNSDNSDYQKLNYYWTCPTIFSTICPSTNTSTLTITST